MRFDALKAQSGLECRILAAAYARLGRMEEAKRETEMILRVEPDATLYNIREKTVHQWKKTSGLEH